MIFRLLGTRHCVVVPRGVRVDPRGGDADANADQGEKCEACLVMHHQDRQKDRQHQLNDESINGQDKMTTEG